MTTEIKDYNDIESSTFEDLNLKDTLLRGIYSCGYEVPSSIQKKAILPVIDKHDVSTSSMDGKTATFSVVCFKILMKFGNTITYFITSENYLYK